MMHAWCWTILLSSCVTVSALPIELSGVNTNVSIGGRADLIYNVKLQDDTIESISCAHQSKGDSREKTVYQNDFASKTEVFSDRFQRRATASIKTAGLLSTLNISISKTVEEDDGKYVCHLYGNKTTVANAQLELITYSQAQVYMVSEPENLMNVSVGGTVFLTANSSCAKPAVTYSLVIDGQTKQALRPQNQGGTSHCKLPNINYELSTARIPIKVGVNRIKAELTAHHPSFGKQTKTFVIHGSVTNNGVPPNNMKMIGIIIGCVVGLVVLCVVIFIAAIYVRKKRVILKRKKKKKRKRSPSKEKDSSKSENTKEQEMKPLRSSATDKV